MLPLFRHVKLYSKISYHTCSLMFFTFKPLFSKDMSRNPLSLGSHLLQVSKNLHFSMFAQAMEKGLLNAAEPKHNALFIKKKKKKKVRRNIGLNIIIN